MTVFSSPIVPENLRSGTGLTDQVEAAMLAHDIRGALQGILGGVATLNKDQLPPETGEQIDLIATSCHSLAGLIGVHLAGMTGEEETPANTSVDFAEFRDYLYRRWQGAARERGIGFSARFSTGLPPGLDMSKVALTRMTCNLIANAIMHTGTGSVEVAVDCGPQGGTDFRVLDTGPGIPQDVIDQVLLVGNNRPGLEAAQHGLGLHIVRNLAESHGGELILRGRDGGGTEAVIRLPASLNHKAAVAEPANARNPKSDIAAKYGLAGLHILLAEDNPTNQMVAGQMLRTLGVEATICSDGVEALEAFEKDEFDLVVVDIEMPRLSGLDVMRRIRARDDSRKSIPIVALTAYALREHRDKISEAGANGLISKPIVSIDALGSGLATHVAGRPRVAGAGQDAATAAAPDPAPEVPVAEAEIDRVVYDALSEAIGPEMMDELLDKVITDLEAAVASLSGALQPLDPAPIRATSHILISVGGAIGATKLQHCARDLNGAAHDTETGPLEAKVRDCLREIQAAVAFARGERSTE